jgi:hypothetical protein
MSAVLGHHVAKAKRRKERKRGFFKETIQTHPERRKRPKGRREST